MAFSTVEFFIFLIAGLLIYYIIPKKIRWCWLLILSYVYYFTYSVKTSILLIATTLGTYAGARLLDKLNSDSKEYLSVHKAELDKEAKKAYKAKIKFQKRAVVWAMIFIAFGILAAVKYGNFIITNINSIVLALGGRGYIDPPSIMLPLGISFYTFQSFSYIIDVYQGKYKAEKNVFKYALFVSFFPQLLQGPIGRFDRLAHQLIEGHSFELRNVQYGLQRIMWGLFKKMVLADRVSFFVSEVFNNYGNYGGLYNIAAVLMYSVQLYADFSGGIDIVIGTAQMYGITMDENFRQPFFSKSISEFWRRWHITLGTWMKDYIFYPFSLSKGMNKFGKFVKKHMGASLGKVLPICAANLLVFFVVGVWHGAEWRYIAYGVYNGVIIAFSSLMEPVYAAGLAKFKINKNSKVCQLFCMIRTFILVNIGFYFDMAPNFGAALVMMKESITRFSFSQFDVASFEAIGLEAYDVVAVAFGCLIILVVSIMKERGIKVRQYLSDKPIFVRWLVYYALIIIILMFGDTSSSSNFLYANF